MPTLTNAIKLAEAIGLKIDRAVDLADDLLNTHFPLADIAETLKAGRLMAQVDVGYFIDTEAELERASGEAHAAADAAAAAGLPDLAGRLMALDCALRKLALAGRQDVRAAYEAADAAWKTARQELISVENGVRI